MKTFQQWIGATPLHEDAILMTLRSFIDSLVLLDAQKSDEDRLVEIREDCPEPGTYAVRLVLVGIEKEDHT